MEDLEAFPEGFDILVIEDNLALAETLQFGFEEIFEELGHFGDVTFELTGSAGVRQLSKAKYDLVILDLGLPDIKGPEVLKAIAETPNQHSPVIILSGQLDSFQPGGDMNSIVFLEKPASLERIKKYTKMLLKEKLGANPTKQEAVAEL